MLRRYESHGEEKYRFSIPNGSIDLDVELFPSRSSTEREKLYEEAGVHFISPYDGREVSLEVYLPHCGRNKADGKIERALNGWFEAREKQQAKKIPEIKHRDYVSNASLARQAESIQRIRGRR